MQTSKPIFAICAVALCASALSLTAQDNPAQAKAREALLQKMRELDAQQAAPPARQPQPTAPPTAVVPAVKSTPATPAPSSKASDAEKKRADAEAAKAQKETAAAEKKRAAAEAKERKEAEKAALVEAQKTKKQLSSEAASGFKPIEAPALPISAEKQALLAELLRKYMADEITPEEYFKQKAKILADQ